jgi:hypothetical protein
VKTWDLIKSEGRLVLRNRWVLILALLLPLFALYAGPFNTFRFANDYLSYLERLRDIQQGDFTQWLLQGQDTSAIREAIWALHPKNGTNYLLSILAILGPMVTPLWGAHFIGSEFTWRTVKVRASQFGWPQTVVAKLIWLVMLNIGLTTLFILLGLVSGAITGSLARQSIWLAPLLPNPELSVSLWSQSLAVILGLSLYAFIGASVAQVTKSTLAGAVAGLVIPYAEWFLLGTPRWGWATPRIAYGNLLADNFVYFQGSLSKPLALVPAPAPMFTWLTVTGWALVFAAMTLYAARYQEIA